MEQSSQHKLPLKNDAKVIVLGGGPAGAFFAIHLLREAKQTHRRLNVTIVEQNVMLPMDDSILASKGCNYCAGVISPRLHQALTKNDLHLPNDVVAESFTHIWIHGLWKNFPLKVPEAHRLISVFRGSLPPGRKKTVEDLSRGRGLDAFLLKKAMEEGATIMEGEALEIKQEVDGNGHAALPLLLIQPPSGEPFTIESDFVAICTGINARSKGGGAQPFLTSYQQINPRFSPPEAQRSLIFELKPGKPYIKKHMDRELYILFSGDDVLDLAHAALIPKGEYLTVALTGKSVDRPFSSRERDELIRCFLSLPHVQHILPGMTQAHRVSPSKISETVDVSENPEISGTPDTSPLIRCVCTPKMAISPAKEPFSDRIALLGDALGARLYRDGLYSAFVGAGTLAQTVIHKGIDRESILQGYGPITEWLERDNHYGKFLVEMIQKAMKSPLMNRILYQSFATEMKFKEMNRWSLGAVLWKVGSGDSDYADVCKAMGRPPVIFSILTGIWKTARNILTELFFGLNWEDRGRYPTVIIKEKRAYFKHSISAPLGITLDDAPEMERMYAIKIRASAERIFQELCKFGEPEGKFLGLRFIDVCRVAGEPGREGAVVQYRLRGTPIAMDIRLIRAIQGKSLLYQPSELFAKRGRLLFDITPTKDGNNRLVIYTAFDFQKGTSLPGKLFWSAFKRLFPDFAHDVVWNHAICTIKGEAEV